MEGDEEAKGEEKIKVPKKEHDGGLQMFDKRSHAARSSVDLHV